MAAEYKIVGWTPFKKRFDRWLAAGIGVYLLAFTIGTVASLKPDESFTPVQVMIRATGTLAFLLLSFVLSLGPLARLSARFKPFLFNRRHLGVATFMIGLVHAGLSTLWYHAFSSTNPIVSLLVSNPRYGSISGFPFESLGMIALAVLFVMAATSHDFWNANLGPRLWKSIHMSVYAAYALLVGHVALGAIQFEKDPVYFGILAGSAGILVALHAATGLAGLRRSAGETDGWLKVALVEDFEDGRAKIVQPAEGEAIAVFLDGNRIGAVSNVCRHQGGPLGEGRIIDGCVTCPWHGFQYRLEDGTSPPPYREKVHTYRTRIEAGMVWVRAEPDPPGTPQVPSLAGAAS